MTTISKTTTTATTSEAIINNMPRTFRDADFPVGSVAHQGDVIVVRIGSVPIIGAEERQSRQVADGDTPGSRHVVTVGTVLNCDADKVAQAIAAACPGVSVDVRYCGPVFCTVGGEANLEHPEHGHHHYRGDMVLACVFQRSLDAEQREARVLD